MAKAGKHTIDVEGEDKEGKEERGGRPEVQEHTVMAERRRGASSGGQQKKGISSKGQEEGKMTKGKIEGGEAERGPYIKTY